MEKKHPFLRSFNKRYFNPVVRRFSGARYSPFALMRHVGRRSGKTYETPIIVRRTPDGFGLALTYGPYVDWLHNLTAAGGGGLRWQGKEYIIGKPQPISAAEGFGLFPLPMRIILRLNRTLEFVKVPGKRSDRPYGTGTNAQTEVA